MKKSLSAAVFLLSALVTLPGTSFATEAPGQPDTEGRPHGSPPQAISACAGKTEGAAVSFIGRHGDQIAGTCHTHDGVMAARPMHRPGEDGGRHTGGEGNHGPMGTPPARAN